MGRGELIGKWLIKFSPRGKNKNKKLLKLT